jgi:pimeloyl-ACP methyl ester carboxylesterase
LFFLSKEVGPQKPKPLALYIQGSGCHSVFRRDANGRVVGGYQNLLLDSSSGAVRVMVVEKPGVVYLDAAEHGGTALGCRPRFLREHTLDRWTAAIIAAVKAAWQIEGIRRDTTLLVGHSEGGIVAASVSARLKRITHVALFGSSGPTQLFDLLENERVGEPCRPCSYPNRTTTIRDQLQDVQRRPGSVKRFAWGHPYRRWSSFLGTSVLDELLRSSAKVRIVHGMRDSVVPVSAAKMLYAELLRRGRHVVVDFRVAAAHNLASKTEGAPKAMLDAFGSTLKWFLAEEKPD